MGYTDTSKTMLAGRALAAFWVFAMLGAAIAQPAAPFGTPVQGKPAERSINEWLERMHQASGQRNYVGTLVVSSNTGAMSSARIWHACQGDQQVERVESLTGAPRSTFRRNEDVVTFLPEARLARTEERETTDLFPSLLNPSETSISDYYAARRIGADRVAGFETDVVHLAPKDS